MLRFPSEENRSAELESTFGSCFALAERLYNSWMLAEKDEAFDRSKIPHQVQLITKPLDVQLLRKYRSVIELCRRGEGASADILSRSMFDTFVALLFILKPRFTIFVKQNIDQKTHAAQIDADGDPICKAHRYLANPPKGAKRNLTPEQRSRLYFAHHMLRSYRLAEKCNRLEKGRGLQKLGRQLRTEISPQEMDDLRKLIGPEWLYIMKTSDSYSGLNFSELSGLLNPAAYSWCKTVWSAQSSMVHSSDALDNWIANDEGMQMGWISSDQSVYNALRSSTATFLAAAHFLHERIHFGASRKMVLDSITAEYKQWKDLPGEIV